MTYKRLHKAKLLAKKRFKYWYYDMNIKDNPQRLGSLRKTNTICSCHKCRNPRHSMFYNEQEKLSIQERRAPVVNEIWE